MKEELLCVVRLQTDAYKRGDAYFYAKSVRVLKRMSNFDLLEEEVSNIGVLEALQNIENLMQCDDGIYELVACNISRDIESGYVDDWDLRLVQYEDKKPNPIKNSVFQLPPSCHH